MSRFFAKYIIFGVCSLEPIRITRPIAAGCRRCTSRMGFNTSIAPLFAASIPDSNYKVGLGFFCLDFADGGIGAFDSNFGIFP